MPKMTVLQIICHNPPKTIKASQSYCNISKAFKQDITLVHGRVFLGQILTILYVMTCFFQNMLLNINQAAKKLPISTATAPVYVNPDHGGSDYIF